MKKKLITASVIATLIATNGYTYYTYTKDTDAYKKEIAENMKVNYNLKESNTDLSKNIDDLEAELNTSVTENKKLNSELKESGSKLNEANSKVKKQESQINSLEEKLEIVNEKLKVLPSVSSNIESSTSGRKLSMQVTAYTSTCQGCSGITKAGVNVSNTIYYQGYRVIAADTSILKMYSIVEIKTKSSTFKAIVIDTGGAIRGNILDLLVNTYSEAIEFGRQQATVTVVREGKG